MATEASGEDPRLAGDVSFLYNDDTEAVFALVTGVGLFPLLPGGRLAPARSDESCDRIFSKTFFISRERAFELAKTSPWADWTPEKST